MRHILFCTTALVGALASGPVFAQSAPSTGAPEATEVDDLVVTATRREEKILDVPYNISAVSGETIDRAKIQDNAELLRGVPGVAVIDRGARNQGVVGSVNMRGLNVDSAALGDYAVSSVAPVSTYVNETPVFANFALKDVDRVEVLRGPQGTLYGSGSLGGTVRYILKAPQIGVFEGKTSVTASKVNGSGSVGWSGDLTLNVPLGEHAALRFSGTRMDYPGLTDYVNVYKLDANGIPVAPSGVLSSAASYESKKDADTVDIWYGRMALLVEPTENIDLTLSYSRQSDKIGGRRQVTRGLDGFGRRYGDYENGSVQLEPSSRDVELTALEAVVDLGFATLTSSSSYFDHTGDSVSENTGFYAKAGFLSFYYNYPRPMASAERSYGDQGFVQEVRLVSEAGGAFDWTAGLFYSNEDLDSTQDSYLRGFKRWWDAAFPAFAAAVQSDQDFIYRRAETFEQKAVFGELTYHVSDTVQVTGGFRSFRNESNNHTFMDVPVYTFLSAPSNSTFASTDSKTLFKLNASWKFEERGLWYATVSQGYRRGGSNAVPVVGRYAEDPAWQVYRPDTVVNYETGVKGRRGPFTYDAALFYVDWKDVQLNTATPNWGFYVVQNGGKARSMGLESQLTARLSPDLVLGLGYTYTDAELTKDFLSPTAVHYLLGQKGDQLPGSPKHAANLGLTWNTRLADLPFTGRVSGYYQSTTRNAVGVGSKFNVPLSGFSLWNVSGSLDLGAVDLTVFVKNVFNEDGVTGRFTESYMGTSPAVGYYGNGSKDFISLPRTLGVSLDYRF